MIRTGIHGSLPNLMSNLLTIARKVLSDVSHACTRRNSDKEAISLDKYLKYYDPTDHRQSPVLEDNLCQTLFWFGNEDKPHMLEVLKHYASFIKLNPSRRGSLKFIGHLRRWIAEDPGRQLSCSDTIVTFDRIAIFSRQGAIVSSIWDTVPIALIYAISVWQAVDGIPISHVRIDQSSLSASVRHRLEHSVFDAASSPNPMNRISDWFYWPESYVEPGIIQSSRRYHDPQRARDHPIANQYRTLRIRKPSTCGIPGIERITKNKR
uniref:Uncharacterized protein n=1 Tax=Spongospora subterranea TaxID=70186 RepID=A0A0H5QIP8_9EUKA|eukprot:CRZ01955.1 hypothetical protein [Spongospora subterranea]